MRIERSAALIGVLAALSGWMVRGISFDAEADPSPVAAAPIASPLPHENYEPLRIERQADASLAKRGSRNLFSYVQAPEPVAKPAVFQPPLPVAAPVITAPPVAEVKPRPRFAHRFIGRFGTADRPIAAFVRDGEIVTLRVGDRIDDRYLLRSIGVESIEVETTVDGEPQLERIPLADSVQEEQVSWRRIT